MSSEVLMVCDNCGKKEPESAHEHGWVNLSGRLSICGKVVLESITDRGSFEYMYGNRDNKLLKPRVDFCSIDCMLKKIDSIMHPKPEK